MPMLTVPNGTIVYSDLGRDRGRGGGADHGPLVLVHGFPVDGRVWDDVVPTLAATRRVVVPDLPGFGRSRAVAPFTMDALADALIALLDDLGVDRAAFAGLSMGGYVLQALVRERPERVERLVFVDTRANADDAAGREARDEMIALAADRGTEGVVEQMLPKMLHADAYASRPDVVERLREIMSACPAETIGWACAAMRDRPDFTADLAALPCPLQIIVGAGDAIVSPTVARAMHEAAPGSRLDVIDGAGHMSPVERADEVARVIGEGMTKRQ